MEKNVIEDVFASDVFDDAKMKDRLPASVYKDLKKTIKEGTELDPEIADVIAQAMKEWALERGATHYTHWFQPMTGITAEKHDSFIEPAADGKIIMEFSGKNLIKGEPDASSFPSGGLRATFEARGYTAWDCTSPAFLKESAAGVILCIPTVFCSYTGEALDKKTPLLRSTEALSQQAIRILKLFGHNDIKKVTCSVGPEQEYFIIDRQKYLSREDLVFTGRTLFGALPPKGQELEDHYFGTIRERVGAFMKEVNQELWKLGVLAKTQHNEVAPAQHELAPIYATVNIATDHNQLAMETLKTVARRHGLECLLHEKPFAGVNGSGKHVNWSFNSDTGLRLLDPGTTPHENLQFLLFLSAVIKAVDDNALLLRLSACNPANDHRLGANEAPPAIISIFLGEQLDDICRQIIEKGAASSSIQGKTMNVGVPTLPTFIKDATDRNRTSPFAFTGNKFEFRMVGSSVNIACPASMLNVSVAEVLREMADKLEKATDFKKACYDLVRETITKHYRVIFNGNGYSDEWVKEAEKRGLPNVRTFVESIPALTTEKTVYMCEKNNVLSFKELSSRAEIQYETYEKTINIEAKTMIDMVNRKYIPAVLAYEKDLADSVCALKSACDGVDVSAQVSIIKKVSDLLGKAKVANETLTELEMKAQEFDLEDKKALFFMKSVVPAMSELRSYIDALEVIVAKKYWPVPSYGDMLFEV